MELYFITIYTTEAKYFINAFGFTRSSVADAEALVKLKRLSVDFLRVAFTNFNPNSNWSVKQVSGTASNSYEVQCIEFQNFHFK